MKPNEWLDAIHQARKEEKEWRDRAKKVISRYREDKQQTRFNILWPNIEIMRPSLYASTPVPDVRRRFRDPDPTGREIAQVIERALSFSVDDYDFDHVMEMAVLDYLLPGRAVARVKYVAYDGDGQVVKRDDQEKSYERVECQLWGWDRFVRGPGRKWRDVQWIAFEHQLTRDELKSWYGAKGAKVNLDVSITDDNEERDEQKKRGRVFEVWDKRERKVIHVAPTLPEETLKEESDPLNLAQFFPIPRPLYAIQTSDSLVPVEEYRLYEKQAQEVDKLSRRISALIDGCRVRGIYNATISEFQQLIDAEDNQLVPAESAAALAAAGQGLEQAIAWMPVEQIASTLAILYTQREAAKQSLYEITGLSDILRGATDPNETLGAQQLKAQTGGQRLQRRQRDVARFARDLLRLKAEIISEHFSLETLVAMTGKEVTQEMMQVMRDDHLRSYRIDIETDSTIIGDATAEKQAIVELLEGVGAFVNGIGPAVESGHISQDAAKTMLKAGIRRFKFGHEVEDALEEDAPEEGISPEEMALQQQQQAELAAQQQAMMEQHIAQEVEQRVAAHKDTQTLQLKAQESEAKTMLEQARLQIEQQKAQFEASMEQMRAQLEAEIERAKLALSEREVAAKEREVEIKAAEQAEKSAERAAKMQAEQQSVTIASQQDSDLRMMLQQLTEAVNALSGYVTAPRDVVYENGKAVGISIGGQVRPIERDASGKIRGLQ